MYLTLIQTFGGASEVTQLALSLIMLLFIVGMLFWVLIFTYYYIIVVVAILSAIYGFFSSLVDTLSPI